MIGGGLDLWWLIGWLVGWGVDGSAIEDFF